MKKIHINDFVLFFITKRNFVLGFMSSFVIFFLVCIFTVHQGLFFLFSNAVVGLVLGFCKNKGFSHFVSWGLLTLSLTVSLSLLFKVFGLNAIVFMPTSEGLYYIVLLCVCAAISLPLYLMMSVIDRRLSKVQFFNKGE